MFPYRFLTVAAVVGSLVLASGAEGAKGAKAKKKGAKAKPVTVEKVEVAEGKTNEGTLTVKAGGKKKKGAETSKFTINAETKISKAAKGKKTPAAAAGLSDIHAGDQVVVSGNGGTADKVEIKKSGKGKGKAKVAGKKKGKAKKATTAN